MLLNASVCDFPHELLMVLSWTSDELAWTSKILSCVPEGQGGIQIFVTVMAHC